MKGRKQIALLALVLGFSLYLGGCFWFWDANPSHWNMAFRASLSIVWVLWIGIATCTSIFDEEDW